VAKAPSTSPSPTANEADKLYHQLAVIHAIAVAQLVECTRWQPSNTTPSQVRASTGQQGPDKMPSTTRMTLPPPTDFSPQASLWQWSPHVEPLVHRWACLVGTQLERCARNPCHGEPSGWRKHIHDPKGLGAEVPRSGVLDVPLTRPF
jgi:hypothetical protein